MSKETEKKTENSLQVLNDNFAKLKELKPVMALNKEYLKMKIDEKQRFIFIGNTDFVDSDGVIIPAVDLMSENKELFTTASYVIVDSCKNLTPYTPVEIQRLDDKKMSKGKTMQIYKITLLA